MEDYNENVADELESIVQLTKEIFDKFEINIQEISDLSFLQNEQFYFEIFKTLFKTEEFLEDDVYECYQKTTPDQKIQILIDLLSDKVLGVDFQDIKGSEIHSGNVFHIRGFLELILALADADLDEASEEDVEYIQEPVFQQSISDHDQYYSSDEQQQNQDKQSISQSKNNFSSKKSNKKQKNQEQKSLRKTQKLQTKINNKPIHEQSKKTIKRGKGVQQNNEDDKFIIKPKYMTQKTKKSKNKKQNEQKFKKNLKKKVINKKVKPKVRQSIQYNINNFIRNPQFLKDLQFLIDQSEIKNAIEKRQQEYNNCLTDFLKSMQRNQKNPYQKKRELQKIYISKQRKINALKKKKQQQLQQEEQANYLYTRDMMLNYLKKLNSTIFKVKRSEKIEQEKKIKEELKNRKRMTELAIKNIENFYKDQKYLLKDKLSEVQQNKEMLLKFEKQRMNQAQKEISNSQQNQINKLIQSWVQKRQKINSEYATERELLLKMNRLLNN